MGKISDIVCCKMRRLLATGHRVGWLGYRLQYVGVCVCVFAWRAVYGERCIRCLCPSLAELVHDSHAVSDPKTKPWTWAWSSCPDGQLPMHVRINVPRGLLTVEDFRDRGVGHWQQEQAALHMRFECDMEVLGSLAK